MALDNVNDVFAKLASLVDEENAAHNPKELAAVTAGLALGRIIVTDLRRIADAQEGLWRAAEEANRIAGERK